MSNKITIAVDAMGGDNSPYKVINGINHHFQTSKNVFYKIFGDENIIKKIIPKSLTFSSFELIHTKDHIKGNDSALSAARAKDTSMWLAIDSVKKKDSSFFLCGGYFNLLGIKIFFSMNLPIISKAICIDLLSIFSVFLSIKKVGIFIFTSSILTVIVSLLCSFSSIKLDFKFISKPTSRRRLISQKT